MASLDLSKHTQAIQLQPGGREVAAALRLVENAVNHLAKNTGAAAIGETQPPDPIHQMDVKVSGEMAHVVLTDNNALKRNVNYFVEYANEPNFVQPHVAHLGTSRSTMLTLPTNQDLVTQSPTPAAPNPPTAGAAHNWYFRAYSQYPGSKPSAHVNFGGKTPAAVKMQGATNLTPLPSTGSGTANSNGQQGAFGFGKFLERQAIAPKRSVQT